MLGAYAPPCTPLPCCTAAKGSSGGGRKLLHKDADFGLPTCQKRGHGRVFCTAPDAPHQTDRNSPLCYQEWPHLQHRTQQQAAVIGVPMHAAVSSSLGDCPADWLVLQGQSRQACS